MTASRTKRQFAGASRDPAQRHITSFFSPDGHTSATAPSSSLRTPLIPALPANVQTNLLSVGMRVRKSVPEGYKTGSPYSGFQVWSDVAKPGVTVTTATKTPTTKARPSITVAAAPRELTPFCGIHKIGGLAVQPASNECPNGDYEDEVPALTDIPGLSSSQESVDEDLDMPVRKRAFDDDDSVAIGVVTDTKSMERIKAVPRARRPAQPVTTQGSDDFEEARFLVYNEMDERF